MLDHLHALLSFSYDDSMSRIIGEWKHFQARRHGIAWQEGYFDHRLRDDERGEQLAAKMDYIRQNPVAAGLCAKAEDWPWVHPFDKVDRALRRSIIKIICLRRYINIARGAPTAFASRQADPPGHVRRIEQSLARWQLMRLRRKFS